MIVCPNCGNQNPDGSRFCANCGASLTDGGRAGEPAVPSAPRDRSAIPPTSPEWRMSDPGPLPEPSRRRLWLWIVLGVVGACVLICVLFFVWSTTVGEEFWTELIGTAEAELTRQAGS